MRSKANSVVAPRDWGVMVEKAYSTARHASDQLASQARKGKDVDLFKIIRSILVLIPNSKALLPLQVELDPHLN